MGPPVEGIIPLPRLDLHELADQIEALGRRETGHRIALGLDAKARSALPGGRNPVVGNGLLHCDKLAGRLYKTHTTVCVLYVAKSLAMFSNFVPRRWCVNWGSGYRRPLAADGPLVRKSVKSGHPTRMSPCPVCATS